MVRIAETILNIIRNSVRITGKPLEIERLTSGLEGGRWKSAPTCRSNSLAAYPTAWAVLRGLESGNRPWLPDTLFLFIKNLVLFASKVPAGRAKDFPDRIAARQV